MKTSITLIILILTGSIIAQAQPILTGVESFESWAPAESGQLPEYWDGFNRTVYFGGMPIGEVACVTKDSLDPKDGNYSAKLTSTSMMGGPAVPGILTTGDLLIDFESQTGDITGGIPFTEKPDRLVGWYKYVPTGIDTGFVRVEFLENGIQVGEGSLKLTATPTSDWFEFTVDITYDLGALPDSVNIIFITTLEDTNVPVGSVLEIDSIAFETGSLGIPTTSGNALKIYPNPTNDFLTIESDKSTIGFIQVFDLTGRIRLESDCNTAITKLDVSKLEMGLYQIVFSDSSKTETHSFIIK